MYHIQCTLYLMICFEIEKEVGDAVLCGLSIFLCTMYNFLKCLFAIGNNTNFKKRHQELRSVAKCRVSRNTGCFLAP